MLWVRRVRQYNINKTINEATQAALQSQDVNRENRRLLFWTFNFFLTAFDKEKLA